MRLLAGDLRTRLQEWPLIRALATSALLTATPAAAAQPDSQPGSILRLDIRLDGIVSPDARLETLADVPGQFTREGPVWVRDGGYLVYTVRNGNRQPGSPPPTDSDIIKWDPRDGTASVLVKGLKADGNTLDRRGRIVSAVNIGKGKIVRLERDGRRTVLASRFGRDAINPNDLVYRSDGVLYFSSPRRYGMATDIPGLFMLKRGRVIRLSPSSEANIGHPGGLALSPDEKHLYVTDNPRIMRFDIRGDHTIDNGRVFFDMSDQQPLANFPDGVKVDTQGNVYVTGPEGVWVLSPEGEHLGTIIAPNRPANLAFGGDDGKTLFITSRPGLFRIPLRVAGPLP